jgi:hypothetical protein
MSDILGRFLSQGPASRASVCCLSLCYQHEEALANLV